MNNIIAITIGDIDGIGIELLINSWNQNKCYRKFILFTNFKIFKKYLLKKKIKIKINIANNYIEDLESLNFYNQINIYDYKAKSKCENTFLALNESYKLTKLKYFIGILTLPLNKEIINKKMDKTFFGQTEFFQKLDKKKISNMIFINKKMIFMTLTNHIPLSKVISFLKKKDYIFTKIKLLNKSLKNDFDIREPMILLSGINPHSGENGLIGMEEKTFINDIIIKIKSHKIKIHGPFPADSIVNKENLKKFDTIVFNYHDQALIPFKLLDNYSGINYTSGLSIIRVSPDHGTAYNLVGKNIAINRSLINCFNFILKISKNRKKFAKT